MALVGLKPSGAHDPGPDRAWWRESSDLGAYVPPHPSPGYAVEAPVFASVDESARMVLIGIASERCFCHARLTRSIITSSL